MPPENGQDIAPEGGRSSSTAAVEVSLINILNIFLRQRWLILGVGVGFAVLTVVALFIAPRTYTVESSFIIQKRDQPPAAGLAAQLGMDLGAADATQSPAFYAALVRTPDVLDRLVDTTFVTSADPKPRSLASIWGISGNTRDAVRRDVIDRLKKVVSSSVSSKLDLVVVDVTTSDALLSRSLADAIIGEVNRFNLGTRQSRAAAERQFDERLVQEVGSDLRQAEDAMQQFLQRNQQPHMSAELEMAKQRLTRRLEILNSRYVSVVTAYDRARIDEVRDTPVITVIQKPRTPVDADARGVPKKTVLMLLLGLFVGCLVAVIRHILANVRSSADIDSREFHQLLDETSGEVRRLWTIVGGRSRRRAGARGVSR